MQDLIWLGIAEMDADLNDLKQIGTTAIHGTSKNVPPDVIPGNWGLLTVSANSKNGQVGCTQHLSIMVTEGYFPQIYERNWNGLNWSKWARIATATPPQEYDLPLADGISTYGKSTYWKTQDGICFINIALYSTQPITTEFVIATLPAGFRPSVKVFAGGHGFSGIDTNVRVGIDVEVNPNGSILIWTETPLENVSGFIGFIADS